MKAIKVSDIAQIVDGQLHGDGEGIVTSVVIDSRKVQNDSMFAAFPGEKVDGHDYIGKAFESGASCCIGNFVPEGETRPMIIVEDVQKALKVLATWYRNTLTIPVIGITGSVGKTTTKEMVSSVLESRFKVLKTEANLNNELGVPLTIFRIEPEHDVAVIEMGISHFQEMTRLAQMAQPDIGIFTVIGYAHLENLGSREGIAGIRNRNDGRIHLLYHYQRGSYASGPYPRIRQPHHLCGTCCRNGGIPVRPFG